MGLFLEVKMPCGEIKYLSPPVGLISAHESIQWNEKMWGEIDLIHRIAKDRVEAIATRENGGLILCKPFEWLRWVDRIPEPEPVTVTEKFAAAPKKAGRPPKLREDKD